MKFIICNKICYFQNETDDQDYFKQMKENTESEKK